uniref:CCHC-type domain-containing protein n=1 Tax=Leptobrachium leishanense TaxID=445787 RepID=A0A8C5W6C2_9ANUR
MSWVKAAQTLKPEMMEELIKQLVQSNALLQAAHTDQQETNRLLAVATQAAITEQKEFSLRIHNQIQSLAERTPSMENVSAVRKRVQAALQKMTAEDDVETFLKVFERLAEHEGLPKDQWAVVLAPFLTGDPQKAYFDLSAAEAQQYRRLKTEILARLGVTVALRARRIHAWEFKVDKPVRSQIYDLVHLTRMWLQPEITNPAQMVERVVVDRFVRALPMPIQRFAGRADPKDIDELVALVERFLSTEDFLRSAVTKISPPPRSQKSTTFAKSSSGPRGKKEEVQAIENHTMQRIKRPNLPSEVRQDWGPVLCWRCHEPGHMVASCPLNQEPMDCGFSRRQSLVATPGGSPQQTVETEKQVCVITVDGCKMTALLDSGSLVTLVYAALVNPQKVKQQLMGV